MSKFNSKAKASWKAVRYQEGNGPWKKWVEFADFILKDKDFNFASATVRGIRKTIAETKVVTQAQMVALNNIYEGGSNKYRGGRRGQDTDEIEWTH